MPGEMAENQTTNLDFRDWLPKSTTPRAERLAPFTSQSTLARVSVAIIVALDSPDRGILLTTYLGVQVKAMPPQTG